MPSTDIVTIDITDKLLELAERAAVYQEALAGNPPDEEDSLQLALYLVAKVAYSGVSLSAVDEDLLLEMASHSGITAAETKRRFYSACLDCAVTGDVFAPEVVIAATLLMRP